MKEKLEEAIRYIRLNPTLSFHHVAVKFGVNVSELQDKYREKRIRHE